MYNFGKLCKSLEKKWQLQIRKTSQDTDGKFVPHTRNYEVMKNILLKLNDNTLGYLLDSSI